jgi:predicted ATPase/DNA-binding CsgD family transcriptional regulator
VVGVDLGRASGSVSIVERLADALGLRIASVLAPEEALERRLRFAPVLILLDDADVDPGGVDRLLELIGPTGSSRVIATVARPLGHADEAVVRLHPLAVPPESMDDPGALREVPAVALYCDRVGAVDPSFRLDAGNAASVAELCRRLDGLPLAIELGAARARVLPPAAQLAALDADTSLDLRPGPEARRGAHHPDLRSAIAATYGLAGEREQIVLRRMAVFGAATSIDRLRAVVGEPGWRLADLLDALVGLDDLGLIEIDAGDDGEPQYRVLPTIADFGREQLELRGERTALEERHTAAYRAAARQARHPGTSFLAPPDDADVVELGAVLERLAAQDRLADALEIVTHLGPYWYRRGLFGRTRDTVEALIEAADRAEPGTIPASIHAGALLWTVRLAMDGPAIAVQRDLVLDRLRRGMELARAGDDPRTVLFGLEVVVLSVFVTGDFAAAAAANAEAEILSATVDEAARPRFLVRTAALAHVTGDFETAARIGAEALQVATARHDVGSIINVAFVLYALPRDTPGLPTRIPGLEALVEHARASQEVREEGRLYARIGWGAFQDGDIARGATWCLRGLEFARQYAAWHDSTFCITTLLEVASERGDDDVVAAFHGILEPFLTEAKIGLGRRANVYDDAVERSRTRLGPERFERLVAEAMLLDRDAGLDVATEFAIRLGADQADDAPSEPTPIRSRAAVRPTAAARGRSDPLSLLTPREQDILRELAKGDTNRQIGLTLGLRPKTVMHHSVSIYGKLGVRGRAEATAWLYRSGLIDVAPAASEA